MSLDAVLSKAGIAILHAFLAKTGNRDAPVAIRCSASKASGGLRAWSPVGFHDSPSGQEIARLDGRVRTLVKVLVIPDRPGELARITADHPRHSPRFHIRSNLQRKTARPTIAIKFPAQAMTFTSWVVLSSLMPRYPLDISGSPPPFQFVFQCKPPGDRPQRKNGRTAR